MRPFNFRSAHDGLDTSMLLSLYLSVVSRLLLISEPVFQLGLEYVGSKEGKTGSEVLASIAEVMCNKIAYIVQPERRKLISIALLKLMSTCEQVSSTLLKRLLYISCKLSRRC